MVSSYAFDLFLAVSCVVSLGGVYFLSRSELSPDLILDKPTPRVYRLYPGNLMRQSGFVPSHFVWVYWTTKCLLVTGLALGASEFSIELPVWGWLLMYLLTFFSLDLFLLQRRKMRKLRVQANLSFFVDLVNAYLKSGVSLFGAIHQAGEHGFDKKHPLAIELKLIGTEIQYGEAFHQALARLSERTGLPQLKALAASFEVGHSAGASMTENLSKQADSFREQQEELNKKLISQKSIMLLFALMMVGLPMFGVIVVFPAAVKLGEIFRLLEYLI